MIGIIDCTEVFIATPKSLELQSATWSEYKPHNTVKFLVCVAPNPSVIYVSEGYTDSVSDKPLTSLLSQEILTSVSKKIIQALQASFYV